MSITTITEIKNTATDSVDFGINIEIEHMDTDKARYAQDLRTVAEYARKNLKTNESSISLLLGSIANVIEKQ